MGREYRSYEADEDFQLVWAQHPRKKNSNDARKAWHQTVKARPPIEKLLQAHTAACEDWRDREAQNIPYLATWLRAHGWEDEKDGQQDEQGHLLSYDEQRFRMEQKRWRR